MRARGREGGNSMIHGPYQILSFGDFLIWWRIASTLFCSRGQLHMPSAYRYNNTKPLWNKLSVREDRLDLLLTLSQLLELVLSHLRKIIAELKQLSDEKDERSTNVTVEKMPAYNTSASVRDKKRTTDGKEIWLLCHHYPAQLIHRTTSKCLDRPPRNESIHRDLHSSTSTAREEGKLIIRPGRVTGWEERVDEVHGVTSISSTATMSMLSEKR
ncbi:hypothetical protein PROFUN_11630 [Planoprotostelium fungivorum]|uniref:Uncharacterized protein n=1 Tax=Planoprotostelium fungivorum TaxID=1890364 RepID=A0A2P6N9P4_9EUKA|nr:hypothetical protein PROFUN_11630 [Planoprotostelium fungivorum]